MKYLAATIAAALLACCYQLHALRQELRDEFIDQKLDQWRVMLARKGQDNATDIAATYGTYLKTGPLDMLQKHLAVYNMPPLSDAAVERLGLK